MDIENEKEIEAVIDLWKDDFLKNPDSITSFVASYFKYIVMYREKSVEELLSLDIGTLDIPDIKALMLHRDYAENEDLQKFVRSFYRYLCTGQLPD